jgi:hypothetical protein
MEMHPFWQILDPFLIWFYRLTGYAKLDFIIGTLFLAGITLLMGESTVFLVSRFIRKRLDRYTEEAEKYQNLSIDALRAGNKAAYKAANELANDAFGHTFFQQLTLSAAFLWPVFFALAWMQHRFLEIEIPIPGTGFSLGFMGAFIPIYIITLWLFKKIKHHVLYSSRVKDSSGTAYDPAETG